MIRKDCFGYRGNHCSALYSMECASKECSFYKPIDVVKAEDIKTLLKHLTIDFRKGLSNKEISQKYKMDAQDVARKKYYLKVKGKI